MIGLERRAAARDSAAMAGPGAPCDPCAPVAAWKRHILRQLRHRDRTQKALFLELVPACECVLGGSGMTGFEEVGLPAWREGLSRGSTCDSGQRRCLSSRGPCILEPVTPLSRTGLSLCLQFPAQVPLSLQDSALPPLSILDTNKLCLGAGFVECPFQAVPRAGPGQSVWSQSPVKESRRVQSSHGS